MSSLKENRCYGLSGGDRSRAHVSVFHVKLTDSAARAIEDGKGWSSGPTICFNGSKGSISVPRSENTDELRVFHFGLTNVARDNPNGSFDCFQQRGSGSAEELSCLGVIQKKMTVNATDDSYEKARQSMTQAEEETRSRGAIVIKQGGRLQGKKVTVRAPGPALAGLTKPRHPDKSRSLLGGVRRGVVQTRQLGERLAHLLALRPYKRPEIILRLQKDGLTASDKDLLDSELMEVGQLNSRDNTFVLKDGLYKELQRDWPGYSSGDQQLLKRIFVRRLFQPQHNLLAVPEAQVSPLRDTPNSSPAHPPKPPPPEDYTDPLASKKPRISRLSGKTSGARPAGKRDTLDPRTLFDSLSAVCRRGADVAERLEAPPRAEEGPRVAAPDPPRPAPARPPSPLAMPELNVVFPGLCVCVCVLHRPTASLLSLCPLHRKYAAISSPVQRQRYKLDFNTEYSEYRDLHARIDGVTRQFMELDTQLKRLHHESHKYKTVRNQILQEYRKIKKSNPNYNQDKTRCEHLHNKLAHIKKLISEYDRQQL
uniref:OCEL domain-containing protein n=1 Tax=Cyclopterus lumpus TaxID=8103 RepID=A0A8C3ANB6_CYCLU